MICTICGSEMKNNGDWFACPTCGSVHFGPDPDEKKSVATPPVKEEKPQVKTAEKPIVKEESPLETAKPITQTPAPKVASEPKPVVKAPAPEAPRKPEPVQAPIPEAPKKPEPVQTPAPQAENKPKPAETPKPPITFEPEPVKTQYVQEESGIDLMRAFSEAPVKQSSFTPKESSLDDDLASIFGNINDTSKADVPDQAEEEEQEAPKKAKRSKSKKESKKESKENGKKKKNTFKDIVDFMIPIVAAIAIAFVLKTFIIANAKVPTGSMIATINVDDRIIASRLAYRTDTPSRYDIILFYYPDDENDVFVKRVLGLPGETLEVVDGVVYITTKDGKTIQTEQSFVNPAEVPTGDFGPYYIPEKGEKISVDGNYCFAENGVMMGQRSFIDKYCTLTPQGDYVISENLYFMMGDNRNNSHDSRGWTNQFVSEDKIIGKVLFKYYPQFEKIQ